MVDDGVTGLLVPYEPVARGTSDEVGPADPAQFARDIAERVNVLIADPARAAAMGRAGRQRVIERFSWEAAARRTIEVYEVSAKDGAPIKPVPASTPQRIKAPPPGATRKMGANPRSGG